MNWILLLSNTITSSIRSIIYSFLIYKLLSTKKPNKQELLVLIGGTIAITVLVMVFQASEFYRITLEAIWIALYTSHILMTDIRMPLFIGIFYEIAISFWQFLFSAWLGVLFHSQQFFNDETEYGQLAIWLTHLVLILLVLYLFNQQNITEKNAFRSASIIVVLGLIAVIALSEQNVITIAEDTLNMWTILAVVLMVSVLVFNINRQYEIEKELAVLKSDQAELLKRDYTTLNNIYATHSKKFHDFHNHIGVLRQLLSHNKLTEAIQYLDELQSPVKGITDTRWTGDKTVDYLINSKAIIANQYNIDYQIQVEFPQHTNLRSPDLCAILGNLLDNALEAARQVPECNQRYVRLIIRRIHQMIIIKVENNFETDPITKEGDFETSKEKNGQHGWGLKSAQTAAEKYDGMVQVGYTGKTFWAVATLSFQGVPIHD